MPRIIVRSPDVERTADVSVAPGGCVLVGRRPDRADVAGRNLAPAGRASVDVALDAARVATNHAIGHVAEGGPITVHDLGRRHGTSVRVAPGAPVTISGADIAEIDLAIAARRPSALTPPPEARWTGIS